MKIVIKFPIEITINTTRSAMEEEMRGFRELFDKFISEPGPSVEWENIQVLNREKLIMTIQLELKQEENKWYKNHDYTASPRLWLNDQELPPHSILSHSSLTQTSSTKDAKVFNT